MDDHDQGCPCFFHQTFYGKLKSSVMCDNCGNITKTEDPMLDLSLDVQVQAKKRAMGGGVGPSATPTLNGCLESFTSPERLMAGVYNCSECGGTPQKATKRLRIKKLPAILCMQLKVCLSSLTTAVDLANMIFSASSIAQQCRRKWKAGSISLCRSTCSHIRHIGTGRILTNPNSSMIFLLQLSTKANWTLDTTTSTASRATRFVYPLFSGLCLVCALRRLHTTSLTLTNSSPDSGYCSTMIR
jgi:hypothetical protein